MSKDRNRRAPLSATSPKRTAARAEEPGPGDRPLAWPGDPEGLTPDAVDFEALAHVLANTCRRGGRLGRFHSLAAHGVLMSEEIEAFEGSGDRREAALHALLVDASVAWLGPEAASSQRGAERLKRLNGIVDRAVRESAGLDAEPSHEQAELLRFVARMAEAAEDRDLPGARDGAPLEGSAAFDCSGAGRGSSTVRACWVDAGSTVSIGGGAGSSIGGGAATSAACEPPNPSSTTATVAASANPTDAGRFRSGGWPRMRLMRPDKEPPAAPTARPAAALAVSRLDSACA